MHQALANIWPCLNHNLSQEHILPEVYSEIKIESCVSGTIKQCTIMLHETEMKHLIHHILTRPFSASLSGKAAGKQDKFLRNFRSRSNLSIAEFPQNLYAVDTFLTQTKALIQAC